MSIFSAMGSDDQMIRRSDDQKMFRPFQRLLREDRGCSSIDLHEWLGGEEKQDALGSRAGP